MKDKRVEPYKMKTSTAILCSALALALIGCGGNGPVSFTNVEDGVLSSGDPTANGHYYDTYTFVATETGTKTFGMTSDEVDSYLVLEDENGDVVREDDDSGEGRDAQLSYHLVNNRTYYLLATSYSNFDQGAYTIGWQDGVDLVDIGRPQAAVKANINVKPKANSEQP